SLALAQKPGWTFVLSFRTFIEASCLSLPVLEYTRRSPRPYLPTSRRSSAATSIRASIMKMTRPNKLVVCDFLIVRTIGLASHSLKLVTHGGGRRRIVVVLDASTSPAKE